jgi:predicted nucleotidyltransferase
MFRKVNIKNMPMKITSPLDKILNNEVKIKILRFLFRTNAEWNGRQIARELKVTPATTHKALQSLNKEGVLSLRNIGKTHVYALRNDNFIVSDILKPIFNKENKILDNILGIIRRMASGSNVKKGIHSIVLFGSVNLHKEHPASDIDIMVIVKDLKSKAAAELLFEKVDKKISDEFGNTLSAYINTISEFKAKKNLAVIKNIIKSNTLIYGKPPENIL